MVVLGWGLVLGGSLNWILMGWLGGGGGGGGGGICGVNGVWVFGNGVGFGLGCFEWEVVVVIIILVFVVGFFYSGSEGDLELGEEEELGVEWCGLKWSLSEMEFGVVVGGFEVVVVVIGGYGLVSGVVSGVKLGKKIWGCVKIKMEFIDNKLWCYMIFSKRKMGIMKKVLGWEVGWLWGF